MTTDRQGTIYVTGESGDTANQYVISTLSNGKWVNVGGAQTLKGNGIIYALAVDSSDNWDSYNVLRMTSGGSQTKLTGGAGIHPLDANKWVHTMTFDAAGNLYAGGNFPDSAGNSYVAEWNGKAWSKLGMGEAGPAFGDGMIDGLVFDKSGNLYASCAPLSSEGTVAGKWDGHSWTAVMSETIGINGAGFMGRDGRGGLYVYAGSEVYYNDPAGTGSSSPIVCDTAVRVAMVSSADTVMETGGSVMLTAKVVAGRGTGTTYEFATDRNFGHVVAAASADSVLTVAAAGLAKGVNPFYVRVQTTNSCDSVLTAIDSVTIVRMAPDTTNNGADTMKIVAGPNPFGSSINVGGLDAAKSYVLMVMNSNGLRVFEQQVTGQITASLEGLTLKQGIYYLEVYDQATGKRVQKITLLKVP